MTESAKRTTERNRVIAGVFQPSASRTEKSTSGCPSAEALGYSHISPLRGRKKSTFAAKQVT
jgi:hypothetical protein